MNIFKNNFQTTFNKHCSFLTILINDDYYFRTAEEDLRIKSFLFCFVSAPGMAMHAGASELSPVFLFG